MTFIEHLINDFAFAINSQAMDCASTDQADAYIRINGVNDWLIK
jgi:hypothetical protein